MEIQKIVNSLNGSDNENSKFATKKRYIDSESNGNYSHHNPINFLTKSIESSLCDYSDAYIMYNLIEYSDNYSDTSGSFWNFKRDEIINNADVTSDDNAPSFKYKGNPIGNTVADRRNKKRCKNSCTIKIFN